MAGLRRSGQASIDSIATSLVASILPPQLRLEWENKTEEDPLVPNIDQWIAFIRKKATTASQSQKPSIIQAASRPPKESKRPQKPYLKSEGKVYINHGESAGGEEQASATPRSKQAKGAPNSCKTNCTLCSSLHFIFQCRQFQEMTVQQRKTHVQSVSLCSNCLRSGHKSQDCPSSFRCRLYKKQHNTLLHTDAAATTASVNHVLHVTDKEPDTLQTQHKMMMTSLVVITGPTGEQLTVRAMLDSGAESSIISKKVMNTLNLKPVDWVNLSGIESPQPDPRSR